MAEYEYSWQKNELGQYCYKRVNKKKKIPAWLLALLVSLGTTVIAVAVFAVLIMPKIRPTTIITQTSGPIIAEKISEASFVGLGEKLSASVVEVISQSRSSDSFFGNLIPFYSSSASGGSGVVVTADGYILTGLAAIESVNCTVRLDDGTEYDAAVVGTDARTGIAILKIEKGGLTPVEFADSSAISSGMSVAAISRALGKQVGTTLTLGSINGVNKGVSLQNGQTVNLFQTDAAPKSSSGVTIVDASGKVVGMVTGMISSGVDGIELAIPSNDIVTVLQSLISFGTATAPEGLTIGIRGFDTEHGVVIESVGKDTPAEKAGLKKDDLILKADSKPIKTVDEINKIKNEHQKGDIMTFTIYRDGEMLEIEVTL